MEDDDRKDERIDKLLKSLEKRTFMKELFERGLGDLVDNDIVSKFDILDDYLPILNCKKINLRTLVVTERTKEDYFTFECPVKLKNKTKHAERYFTELFPKEEIREYVRRVCAYMLTGNIDARKFFVFYGSGSNSKSVLIDMVSKILGKYHHACSPSVFTKSKSDSGGASPHLFSLMGKRLATYSEGDTSDKMEMDVANIKKISGGDEICCRGLYKDELKTKLISKLVMMTNFVPPLNAEKAIVDRLNYVFFDTIFSHDPKDGELKIDVEFVNKLQTDYLSEVFTYIVQACPSYYETCRIDMPKEFEDRTKKILENEDSITTFVTRFIRKTNN